ncbi:MAG: hypothetical protein ACRES6_04945 [Steroidobacteraceae bacterium]
MKYTLGRTLEIGCFGRIDVLESLGIPVHQREPAALHPDEDAIALLEGVVDIVHRDRPT